MHNDYLFPRKLTRRDFLATASVAAAGLTLSSPSTGRGETVKIGEGKAIKTAPLDEMNYHVLGDTGDQLQVRTRTGVTGWFNKSDAVLLDDAVAYFSKQIEQNPSGNAYNARATARRLKGDTERAIKDYTEAVRLDPRAYTYSNRANAYHDKKDYDKAIADFTEAIRLNPTLKEAFLNRGAALYSRGTKNRDKLQAKVDLERALSDLTQAIALDERYARAFNYRARVHRDLGNATEAAEDRKRYESLSKSDK